MKILVVDSERQWISKTINNNCTIKHIKNADILETILNSEPFEFIFIHDTDFWRNFNCLDDEQPQDVYCDVCKPSDKQNLVVYSGGELKNLTTTNNFYVVPYIPHKESECPTYFSEFLRTLDTKSLNLVNNKFTFRSKILTPFTALHLALQMEKEKSGYFENNLSSEEQSLYQEGVVLLEDSGKNLSKKFCDMLEVVYIDDENTMSQPQKNLNTNFIDKCHWS